MCILRVARRVASRAHNDVLEATRSLGAHIDIYVDASLATVSVGRYTQAVRHIVAVNLTSFSIVITEYSKGATILHSLWSANPTALCEPTLWSMMSSRPFQDGGGIYMPGAVE